MSVERLTAAARTLLQEEIAAAHGREVSFVVRADPNGTLTDGRVVARGTVDAVLALPGVAQRGEMLIHNHPSGFLEPSGADLHVAARLHDDGVGFGIVNNDVSTLYIVVEMPRARQVQKLDSLEIANLLTETGPVARVLGAAAFEDRPGQRDMAAYIADAYNDGGIALLEAGTGVGKSFAYLVPAIEWARVNGERTVVSTNTINLQEQLVGKDLPILARAFSTGERAVTFALLKGWRNYLCLSRLEQARAGQESLFDAGRSAELEAIAGWAARTADGSLADLVEEPSNDVWDAVAAESDLCTRLKCPHFDRCFVFAARRRAAEADVVVVNHHLLASDLAVRIASDNWQEAAVLPPYRRLVLDEAHHLEDVAAQHLGTAGEHARRATAAGPPGAQRPRAAPGARRRARDAQRPARLGEPRSAEPQCVRRPGRRAALVGGAVRAARRVGSGPSRAPPRRRCCVSPTRSPTIRSGAKGSTSRSTTCSSPSASCATAWRPSPIACRSTIPRKCARDSSASCAGSCGVSIRAAEGLKATLQPVGYRPSTSPAVRWMERRGRRTPNLTLAAVPLDMAPILKESLFDRVETVVLTSATLAAGGEFTFLEERLGLSLPPSRVTVREVLPSPFDFGAQCVFGIPTDIPEPRDDESGHGAAVARVLLELAHASDGGIFALFTSHGALRRTADAIRGEVGARWPLLVQGEGQRDQLLRRFRDAGSAILLGTDSFWEGVDVPGRALRVLILAKLPFKVPSEPLTAARLERLTAAGVDGFSHYLVPLAALKLKQGFGRLIRTKSDVGAVVLLDRRVVTKRYGAMMLEGLPPAAKAIGNWPDILRELEEFFAMHSIGAPPPVSRS